MVLDVAAISPRPEFDRRLKQLIQEIHAAEAAEGVERVLLPGEREWGNYRRALESGIDLSADVVEKLQLASKLTGVGLP